MDPKKTAQLLSIDIKELCNVENVSCLVKPNNIGVLEDESDKFPEESTFNAFTDIYYKSTKSVYDSLLGIFDDGNYSEGCLLYTSDAADE